MAKTELPGTQIKNKSVDPVEDLLLPTGSNSGSFFLKGDGYWASTSSFYSGSYSGSYEGSGYGLTNIQSSSYAVSASWAPGGSSVSASYATTSSFSNKSSLADSSTSSSYAVSASWAPRLAPRVNGTTTSAAPTPNADTTDIYSLTALAEAAVFGAPTGTPVNGQKLIIRIKDNGTARALSFNASYVAGGVALPTTTVLSKIMHLGFQYNTDNTLNKWQLIAKAEEV